MSTHTHTHSHVRTHCTLPLQLLLSGTVTAAAAKHFFQPVLCQDQPISRFTGRKSGLVLCFSEWHLILLHHNQSSSVTCRRKCLTQQGNSPTSPSRPSCPMFTSASWHCSALSSLLRFLSTCWHTSTLSVGTVKKLPGYQQSSMIMVNNTVSTLTKTSKKSLTELLFYPSSGFFDPHTAS